MVNPRVVGPRAVHHRLVDPRVVISGMPVLQMARVIHSMIRTSIRALWVMGRRAAIQQTLRVAASTIFPLRGWEREEVILLLPFLAEEARVLTFLLHSYPEWEVRLADSLRWERSGGRGAE